MELFGKHEEMQSKMSDNLMKLLCCQLGIQQALRQKLKTHPKAASSSKNYKLLLSLLSPGYPQ
jgi:predicted solute-binding protein